MAETVNTNQFKNGMHIEIEGGVWRIVDFQHVKPGKGGAFVRTKVKNIDTGAVVDKTFRAGEKFQRMHTEVKSAQYLYDSGDDVVFMEDDTYEQFSLPRKTVAEDLAVHPSVVRGAGADGGRAPSGLQLPSSVELAVAETEPGVKGDTVSNVTKPAKLETGAVVQVPLFVRTGDRIKVDPREGRYISRAPNRCLLGRLAWPQSLSAAVRNAPLWPQAVKVKSSRTPAKELSCEQLPPEANCPGPCAAEARADVSRAAR